MWSGNFVSFALQMQCNSREDGKTFTGLVVHLFNGHYFYGRKRTALFFKCPKMDLRTTWPSDRTNKTHLYHFQSISVRVHAQHCDDHYLHLSALSFSTLFHASAYVCLQKILFPECLLAPSFSSSDFKLVSICPCSFYFISRVCRHRSYFSLSSFSLTFLIYWSYVLLSWFPLFRSVVLPLCGTELQGAKGITVNSDRVEKPKVLEIFYLDISLWFPALLSL